MAVHQGRFLRPGDGPLGKKLVKIPLMQWLQPSKKMDKKTPTEMQSTRLADFYKGN